MGFIFSTFTRFLIALLIVFFCLFFLKNQHLTISLVQLEVLGLTSLLAFSGGIMVLEKEIISIFIIIVVVVIEASLGLSLIVKQARNLNKEFFKFFF